LGDAENARNPYPAFGGVRNGRVTVPKAGTPVPFSLVPARALWIEMVADPTNKGVVYTGGTNASRGGGPTSKTYEGIPLYPGVWLLYRTIDYPSEPYDLRYLYIDADNSGDSMDFVYGVV
jgi:hypothetical protein